MDGKLRIEERAKIASRYQVWKSVTRSLDLIPCAFLSWELGKQQDYKNNSQSRPRKHGKASSYDKSGEEKVMQKG